MSATCHIRPNSSKHSWTGQSWNRKVSWLISSCVTVSNSHCFWTNTGTATKCFHFWSKTCTLQAQPVSCDVITTLQVISYAWKFSTTTRLHSCHRPRGFVVDITCPKKVGFKLQPEVSLCSFGDKVFWKYIAGEIYSSFKLNVHYSELS